MASTKAASTAAESAEQSRTPCRAGEHDNGEAAPNTQVLRHGRRSLLRIVPDGKLWRVDWPDIGLSQPVNLVRAKEAARLWAESKVLRDIRKNGAERALKSLDNFSWSSSPMRKNEAA